MEIGFIGLGKMGLEMSSRAVQAGHRLVGYDNSPQARENAEGRGIPLADSLQALVGELSSPRVIWMQLPPGKITNQMIHNLGELIAPGDLLIDGGNTDFRDTVRSGKKLKEKGIRFMDVGVSGGVEGAKNGCGMLIGGEEADYRSMIPFFESLAAPDAYSWCGGCGAGHYAKTIHNGVEYAIMQAYAEGYEMLTASEIDVDVLGVLHAYQNGCSIRSHILGQIIKALEPDVKLEGVEGFVADSGMGRWTVEESVRLRVPTPTITAALQQRFRSQQEDSPAMKCLAAARGVIGGHPVKHK
ncbi:6-phosphogluconate dehydrogenase (decarboxylating) [Lachnoclostridium sp. An131]|uniref:phosphogluconate dehydrogenase (NAD(+)-dependent, decarboxylating) n=1 Tax=Lachnoclostridium sp. An131 TaxID=1965555 RepID=UPI000B392EA9|nr:decarboxylating 6-phosphogluconate dehydrogenase [Lachnoclostridium sp. An131]OUQ24266.1 6-phosphogluconate dehydrogenase (decarboxylating) [Lachnoclostridium sp. An131]